MSLYVSDNSVWLSGCGSAPWRMPHSFVSAWLDQLQRDAEAGDHAARSLFNELYKMEREALGEMHIPRVFWMLRASLDASRAGRP